MSVWQIIKEHKSFLLLGPFKAGPQAIPIRPHFLGYMILSGGMLGAALLLQYVGGLEPCAFCIYERWPYVVAGVLAALGFFMVTWRCRTHNILLIFITLSYLTNVGLSAYHVAIEHKWVAPPSVCGSRIDPTGLSFEDFKEKLLSSKVVPCDKIPMKILGLSLVEYNLIITLFVLIFSLFLTRKRVEICYNEMRQQKKNP